jgi:hypothetical protein
LAERDFDEEFANDDREGHTFVLGGQKFHTLPVTTPKAHLTYFTLDREKTGMDRVVGYLRAMIVPDELEAFNALVDAENTDILISAKQLDEVASWLLEVTSGLPTTAPARSGGGRKKTSE